MENYFQSKNILNRQRSALFSKDNFLSFESREARALTRQRCTQNVPRLIMMFDTRSSYVVLCCKLNEVYEFLKQLIRLDEMQSLFFRKMISVRS